MSPSRRCAPPTNAGFSLIELLIVISLIGLFLGAVQESLITGLRAVSSADSREEIRQQLASALERFAREASVADNVDGARTDEFNFDTPSADLDYEYDSTAGTLSREGDVILRHLTAFDFDYVDCQGTLYTGTVSGSSTEDSLRLVQVAATVMRDQETIAVAQAVFLRNMLGQTASTCGTL